jgi:glycosyltransferase involved in cell wall biosynthesis
MLFAKGNDAMPRTALYLIPSLEPCGPVHVLREIVRHLDRERYRAVVATLSAEPLRSCLHEFRALGVEVAQINLSRLGYFFWGSRRLRGLAHAVNADLLHTHGFRADLLAAAAGLSCPIVSTLHCDLLADYRYAYGRFLGTLMARRQFAALRRLHAVAAVSIAVAHAARSAAVHAQTVLNGVDLSRFHPLASRDEIHTLRRRLELPLDVPVLLHCGALIPRKNPLAVLEGFRNSLLARRALLVFAGDGPLRARCHAVANGDPRIRFLGPRGDIPDLLRASDLLLSHADAEGLPMALLEGCATGMEILATRIPPHEELRALFPRQVTLFAGAGSSSLTEALDTFSCRDTGPVRPAPAALERISGRTMSLRYQQLYDAQFAFAAQSVPPLRLVAHSLPQKE